LALVTPTRVGKLEESGAVSAVIWHMRERDLLAVMIWSA